MRTAIAVMLVLAVCAAPAAAQTVHMKYMGPIDCGTWDTTGGPDAPSRNAVKLNFVLGFLIGKSFDTKRDMLGNVTIPGINAWMSQYCAAHPLETVISGMGLLESELTKTAPPLR